MYAVVVHLTLKPGTADRFLPLVHENAAASLRDEDECHQLDVCTDPDLPGEVLLYELYSDADAFGVHLKTAHFLHFDAATKDMIDAKVVKTYRWVAQ